MFPRRPRRPEPPVPLPDLDAATRALRAILARAHEESLRMEHAYIGTEHLLLGIAREPKAVPLFQALGVTLEQMRLETAKLLGMPFDPNASAAPAEAGADLDLASLPFTSRTRKTLWLAQEVARRHGAAELRPRHLLEALIREGEGVAAAVLANLGVTPERVRAALRGAEPAPPPHGLCIDDQSDLSIYEQLVTQVREGVATGRLRPGARLPSVRALADELDVAPGTVARAYAELERLGVVVTEGARGTRVAERAGLPDDARAENLTGLLRPVVVAAFHLGATAAELRDALERAMKGILNGGSRGDAPAAG